MALPIGFEIDKCIPSEEDIRAVISAKLKNDTSIFTDSSLINADAQPFYYDLIRRYVICVTINWEEAAEYIEQLLDKITPEEFFDDWTLRFLVSAVKAKKLNETNGTQQYTIVGYGTVGTRKDSAYDLGSAKDRAEKMLQDKFIQKVDILQQNNIIWSSKPMQAQPIAEAIEKHDTLNQKLFDGEELKQEVKDKVEEITNEMIRLLTEENIKLEVRDVILTGSNVSYNYTKDSDIDVHILAKTSDLNDPDKLYPALYNAYRRIFANKYDITFYGIPVEVYIEVEGNETASTGAYSVMFDKWIRKPEAMSIPDINQAEIDKAAKPWKDEAEEILKQEDIQKIDDYINRIYEMRQKGLYNTNGVEFSTENLIFKEVRNAGLLDKLKQYRDELTGKELSLESLEEELDERTRREYVAKIAQIAHDQPIVHPNGIFELHNISEQDANFIIPNLRRMPWIEHVAKSGGRYDFSRMPYQGIPAMKLTITGKIKIN